MLRLKNVISSYIAEFYLHYLKNGRHGCHGFSFHFLDVFIRLWNKKLGASFFGSTCIDLVYITLQIICDVCCLIAKTNTC